MPLDGHAYLVAQGWKGKGSGLRHDGISRPIVVAQKKTLSGIGKDRDEAFPFWDHVFNAAVSSVKIKIYDSDSDDSESSSSGGLALQRTTTGLISNRRPTAGTPALSGTATPTTASSSSSSSGTSTPKISVLTAAKQAAARRALYSMFFRGPVLANEFDPSAAGSDERAEAAVVAVTEVLEEVELDRVPEKKKRKRERDQDQDQDQGEGGEEEERRRVKREKREKKEERRAEAVASGSTSSKEEKDADTDETDGLAAAVGGTETSEDDREARKAAKAERKRLRAEKRARKEERGRRRAEKASAPPLSPDSAPTASGETRLDEGEENAKRKRDKGDKKAKERRKKP